MRSRMKSVAKSEVCVYPENFVSKSRLSRLEELGV